MGGQPSVIQRRQLAELHAPEGRPSDSDSDCPHVFSIDGGESLRRLWDNVQKKSQVDSPRLESRVSIPGESSIMHEPHLGKALPPFHNDNDNTPETFKDCFYTPNRPLDGNLSLLGGPHAQVNDRSNAMALESHRVHHFNTTNPPQLCGPGKTTQISNDYIVKTEDRVSARSIHAGKLPDARKVRAGRAEHHQDNDIVPPNLTLEGKRQAQLAGEKFRARGLYSRPRKTSAGQGDRSNYHNRWASYEKPEAFFCSASDKQRQAQSAADRLRTRSSRIRHGSKGFPNLAITLEDNTGLETMSVSGSPPPRAEESDKAASNPQKSLLEVFESELAKDPMDSACQTDPYLVSGKRSPGPSKTAFADQTRSLASTPHLQSSEPASTAIETGIRDALNGFEACLRGIVDTLKAAQPLRSDQEVLCSTLDIFRDLAKKAVPQTAASFNTGVNPATANPDLKAGSGPEDMQKLDCHFPVMAAHTPAIPESWKPLGKETKQDAQRLWAPSRAQTSHTQNKHGKSGSGRSKPEFISDLSGPLQYHPPGPIHLPQQNPVSGIPQLSQSGVARLQPSGYAVNPSCFHSADVRDRQQQDCHTPDHRRPDNSASLLDIATRFPTIRQFEDGTCLNRSALPTAPSLIDLDPEVGPGLSLGPQCDVTENETESSGQFFNRMTARNPPQGVPSFALQDEYLPNCNIGVSPVFAASKATLLRPFDAFAAEPAPRNQHDRGVHRSATVAARTLRRPQSEVFPGNHRVAWGSPPTEQCKPTVNESVGAEVSSTSLPLPVLPTMQRRPLPQVRPAGTLGVHRSATDVVARRETSLRPRDTKVRKCIDSLIGLGFDLDRSRLRAYASVADGDLDEAIDILTEDQKVHESRM